jgi:hypothetical protein
MHAMEHPPPPPPQQCLFPGMPELGGGGSRPRCPLPGGARGGGKLRCPSAILLRICLRKRKKCMVSSSLASSSYESPGNEVVVSYPRQNSNFLFVIHLFKFDIQVSVLCITFFYFTHNVL